MNFFFRYVRIFCCFYSPAAIVLLAKLFSGFFFSKEH